MQKLIDSYYKWLKLETPVEYHNWFIEHTIWEQKKDSIEVSLPLNDYHKIYILSKKDSIIGDYLFITDDSNTLNGLEQSGYSTKSSKMRKAIDDLIKTCKVSIYINTANNINNLFVITANENFPLAINNLIFAITAVLVIAEVNSS